jgi:hypothetical protein
MKPRPRTTKRSINLVALFRDAARRNTSLSKTVVDLYILRYEPKPLTRKFANLGVVIVLRQDKEILSAVMETTRDLRSIRARFPTEDVTAVWDLCESLRMFFSQGRHLGRALDWVVRSFGLMPHCALLYQQLSCQDEYALRNILRRLAACLG